MARMSWVYAQVQGLRQGMELIGSKDYVCTGSTPTVASFSGLPTIELEKELGPDRFIRYSAIDEKWHTAAAIGSALVGVKAVNWHGMYMANPYIMQLVTQHAAKLHHMTGGQATIPAVFVVGMAGKQVGMAGQHSDYEEDTWFAHTPGLKTIEPSTVYDAKGLMISAIKCPDPVVYLNAAGFRSLVDDIPAEAFEVPIGKAAVRMEGKDITIVSHGPAMPDATAAAERLKGEGVSVELIDLRSLHPIDTETLVKSAKKTGRVLSFEWSKYTLGPGAEVIARIAEGARGTHVKRIAHPDAPPAGAPEMVTWTYPDSEDAYAAAKLLLQA